jgi:Zn-dependent protease with chaperone function
MLPPDLAKNLRPIGFKVQSELLHGEPAHYLPESNTIALSQKVLENATPEELRGYLWHELGHWLYFNAHRDPRVFRWRAAIDQHWRKRTQGKPIKKYS